MKRNPNQRGFTLVELMIVVMIMGILAAIAYPSYVEYVKKTRRSGAQSFMTSMASKQEQYLLDSRVYADDSGGTTAYQKLNVSPPGNIASYYTFTTDTTAPAPLGYTITATAIGAQAGYGNLTLDSRGVKTPADKW